MLNMGVSRLRKSFAVAFGYVLEFRGLRALVLPVILPQLVICRLIEVFS